MQVEQLRDNEKALAYGGGVIANILLYLFICMVVLVMSFVNGAPSTPRGIDPLVYATLLVLVCIVLTCYARFVCRYIFPIIGMVILVWFGLVLWKVFGNIALLEGVGFAGIAAAGAESARAADVAVTGGNGGGHLLSYLGMLSLLVGLTNLLPLIPLDGGHLMMIHVEKWAPKCKSYFVRLGIALAVFLLLFQFVPDLYNVFT